MTRSDLLKRVKQRPFAPLRLIVSEGAAYDIRHPEQVMVARDSAVIGLKGEQEQEFFETTVLVDLFHIIRLEPLETGAKAISN
jgi:hypothetical protein